MDRAATLTFVFRASLSRSASSRLQATASLYLCDMLVSLSRIVSMTTDWFHALTGFTETAYADTQANLHVAGTTLRSKVNGQSYQIGTLETPSVADLRERAAEAMHGRAGRLRLSIVSGDAAALHRDPANRGALFQVASQFNLLEMVGPNVTPEHGVTRYASDPTQGPACAVAAGAATIYRNYCVPVKGQAGQTQQRQVDCLHDIGSALGNRDRALWTMQNGYALCTDAGLATITRALHAMAAHERDAVRDRLRVGVHWDVQVTGIPRADQLVSQAFCSALPVSYTDVPSAAWRAFATLVLEGAYEATLWAAVLNAQRTGANMLFLTQVGGGAFGNDAAWIHGAIQRALRLARQADLDVRLVTRRGPSPELQSLAAEFR